MAPARDTNAFDSNSIMLAIFSLFSTFKTTPSSLFSCKHPSIRLQCGLEHYQD